MDLRCKSVKHAEIYENTIEVKCRSRMCGAEKGVVVIHVFDLETKVLLDTKKYKEPIRKL